MGTRGAFGFFVDGKTKVTYNHFDSYPEGLGNDILTALVDVPLDIIQEAARSTVLVSEDDKPSPELIERYKKYANTSVSTGNIEEWYVLLRNVQGEIGAFWDTEAPLRHMPDGENFLSDSLFCEYAYIVNVDTGKLEVYKGFNKNFSGAGRYVAKPDKNKESYAGVELVLEIPLDRIKENTIQALVKEMCVACGDEKEDEE